MKSYEEAREEAKEEVWFISYYQAFDRGSDFGKSFSDKQHEAKPWNYCPECGNHEYRNDPNFAKTHRQCTDMDCLQEYHTDINYSDTIPKVLASKLKKIKQHEAEIKKMRIDHVESSKEWSAIVDDQYDEISNLKNIIADKLSEHDDFGSEFVIKAILTEQLEAKEKEISGLKERISFYQDRFKESLCEEAYRISVAKVTDDLVTDSLDIIKFKNKKLDAQEAIIEKMEEALKKSHAAYPIAAKMYQEINEALTALREHKEKCK